MLQPQRLLLFQIAEVLGTPVYVLEREMPLEELEGWIGYFEWKNAMRETARNKNKNKNKR